MQFSIEELTVYYYTWLHAAGLYCQVLQQQKSAIRKVMLCEHMEFNHRIFLAPLRNVH